LILSSSAQDNDDDGESGAAGKMADLLQIMGANDVCVVVSRWVRAWLKCLSFSHD
jgi:putative IMPACT (imprinted ancient) family translation regulator